MKELTDSLENHLITIRRSLKGDVKNNLDILIASDILEKNITWFWQYRIADGTLNFLSGDMDKGKSYISLDLAARLSRGGDMPDGTPGPPPGNVLIIAQEDSYQKAAVKRMRLQGADLSRIFVSRGVPTDDPDIFRMWRALQDRRLL